MPGYIIHLAEAKKIIELLMERKLFVECSLEEWQDSFLYGVLLPDAVDKNQKGRSHFWKDGDLGKVVITPDLESFQNKYDINRKNPILCEYFAHLHLDKMYWEKYFKQSVCFFDKDKNDEERISQISSVKIVKSGKMLSLQELFSEKYLYGDYTKLNYYLVDKYKLSIFNRRLNKDICIEGMPLFYMEKVEDKLQRYLNISSRIPMDMNVFTEKSLVEFIDVMAKDFVDMFEQIQ